MNTSMTSVIFKNVSKIYKDLNNKNGDVKALKNISFSLEANEILVVIGPSGCGKTTILNLIAGFINPTTGEVLFEGQAITRPSIERTIIFQEYVLFPWYSVRNNIEFGLVAKNIPAKERHYISDKLLQMIHLEKFADSYPHQLSGGMKQRVALARALAVEPKILLMDEPFGALDAQTRSHLQQSLLDIWKINRTTIIFVTHSIDEALTLGNKILVLSSQPAENIDFIEISKPFPRDLVCDEYFKEIKIRIRKLLDKEFNSMLDLKK